MTELLGKKERLRLYATGSNPYPSVPPRVCSEICNNRCIKFLQLGRTATKTCNRNMRAVLHGLQNFAVHANRALVSNRSRIFAAEILYRSIRKGELVETAVAWR